MPNTPPNQPQVAPVDPTRPTMAPQAAAPVGGNPNEATAVVAINPALARLEARRRQIEEQGRKLLEKQQQERQRNEAARQAAEQRDARKREAAERRQRAAEQQAQFDELRDHLMNKSAADLVDLEPGQMFVLVRETLREQMDSGDELREAVKLHRKLLILILAAVVVVGIAYVTGRTSSAVPAKAAVTAPASTEAPVAEDPSVTPAEQPAAVAATSVPTSPFTANCLNETPGDVVSAALAQDGHFHGKKCLPADATSGLPSAVVCTGKTRKLPPGLEWAGKPVTKGFQSENCSPE